MNNDLQEVEKQLLNEWKRFRQVSMNNFDPNFKPQMITKLFQVKSAPPVHNNDLEAKKINVDSEMDGSGTPTFKKPINELQSNRGVNSEHSATGGGGTPSKVRTKPIR